MSRFQALEDILEEEISVLEDMDPQELEGWDLPALRSAHAKLRSDSMSLTDEEKHAVTEALSDVGDLYLQSGTGSGYKQGDDVDSTSREVGRAARRQARSLGVRIPRE